MGNQLMEERPEIARVLDDPEMMRQSMQMIRNPSLMREFQRNSDRAIGHLDVMPGGHNALARAHEEMVDPLMAAMTNRGQDAASAVDAATYASQTEGAPNNEALPNPWGAPPAAAAPAPAASPAPAVSGASPAPFASLPSPAVPSQATSAQQANPMAAMMQQMMNNPEMMQQSMQMMGQMSGGQQNASPAGGMAAAAHSNPMMAAIMQQAAADPETMQQSMQMATQMMNDNPIDMQQSLETARQAAYGQSVQQSPAPQLGNAANPFAAMMQQMMSNPAMMQQQSQMAQQMFGFPGPFGAAGMPTGVTAPNAAAQGTDASAAVTVPGADALVRMRFATQLAQLSTMGFCNEAACLRALQTHQGRVDAAIDALLASGDGNA